MRATGLMLSSEATCLAHQSAKTATPQGAKDRASQQGAMPSEREQVQDQSTSSRFAQLDPWARLDWRETTKESLFHKSGLRKALRGCREFQSRITRVPRGVNKNTPGAIFSILPSMP